MVVSYNGSYSIIKKILAKPLIQNSAVEPERSQVPKFQGGEGYFSRELKLSF